jgi:hypothetical protein
MRCNKSYSRHASLQKVGWRGGWSLAGGNLSSPGDDDPCAEFPTVVLTYCAVKVVLKEPSAVVFPSTVFVSLPELSVRDRIRPW